MSVEDEEVLSEGVVEVSCRWCGHGRAVEVMDDSALDAHDPDEVRGVAAGADPQVPASHPGTSGAGAR